MIGIYGIKNKINGKIYVGQSIDIKNRWTSETKLKIRNAITGIKRSEETKRKISQSKLGKKHKGE